jgi:hypothetical protein
VQEQVVATILTDDQIRWLIVPLVLIKVMHFCTIWKFSPNGTLCDGDMLTDLAPKTHNPGGQIVATLALACITALLSVPMSAGVSILNP